MATNLYYVLNRKNPHGGQFYNIYSNEGELLDISQLVDLNDIDRLVEDVREASGDKTFKKVGGIITRLGEKIGTTNVYNGLPSGRTLPKEVLEDYERLEVNYQLIDRIQAENRRLYASIKEGAEKGRARVLTRKTKPNDNKE